ncbi:class I SAM-dependent methyltransferase [Planctomicrobium sp. SH668]|uniref:class I SAM-dependent methyltransferase n=1 Tax=Planctomicrobium sp. SH668 TaxID=3448126 RepID=UPI003F5B9F86
MPGAEFFESLLKSMNEGDFLGLTLSAPRKSGGDQPRKENVRPVVIRGKKLWQWALQFEKQQTQKNLSTEQSIQRARDLFGPVYRDATLLTSNYDLIGRVTPQGIKIRQQAASRPPLELITGHNRQKPYLIPEGVPCPFLIELAVMNANGHVKQARQKKFRQINRYLEIVNDTYHQLPQEGVLRVVDFGCGLSYLTFALHHLLAVIRGRDVIMVGIDQNQHVIDRCQAIVEKLSLKGISFSSQKIDQFSSRTPVDLAVSLHACDTATDHALTFAVGAGAKVILAAPCCQHELFTKIQAGELQLMLKHGIVKERFAAMATDSLRASALESVGYKTQILEFIDLEHTPKNILIRSVLRQADSESDRLNLRNLEEYQQFKRVFGVDSLATDDILNVASSM